MIYVTTYCITPNCNSDTRNAGMVEIVCSQGFEDMWEHTQNEMSKMALFYVVMSETVRAASASPDDLIPI